MNRHKRWRKRHPAKWRAQQTRYYRKSEAGASNKGRAWSYADVDAIMERLLPDSRAAKIIGRSVKAIQIKRCRIRSSNEAIQS